MFCHDPEVMSLNPDLIDELGMSIPCVLMRVKLEYSKTCLKRPLKLLEICYAVS